MVLYKIGSPKSEVIKQIQKALHLIPDGIFGPITKEAVMDFQAKNNLKVDGIVGPATLAKLLPVRLKKSTRVIKEIIVHCTADPEGKNKTVEEIRKEHIKNRGWSDIGYHYVVYRDGSVHEGRNVNFSGAHCSGHNANSIGVVYVGGLENVPGVPYNKLKPKDTRTEEQKAALLSLLLDLRNLYPNATILGHRDTSPDKNGNGVIEEWEWLKACPSFDAKTEYKRI